MDQICIGPEGPRLEPIRSVELSGAKISLLFRHGDLDVLVSDIGAHHSVSDASLTGGFSWHLVTDGRALLQQGDRRWEVLPAHSLTIAGAEPYRIVNPGDEPLRVLTIVVGGGAAGDPVGA